MVGNHEVQYMNVILSLWFIILKSHLRFQDEADDYDHDSICGFRAFKRVLLFSTLHMIVYIYIYIYISLQHLRIGLHLGKFKISKHHIIIAHVAQVQQRIARL